MDIPNRQRRKDNNALGGNGKAETVVCEDLTKTFKSKNLGKNTNRRLSGWVKGLMASAIDTVASRRGSRVVQVNAAYTSQTCSQCLWVRGGYASGFERSD
jgi:IS605 OrfB family transposase